MTKRVKRFTFNSFFAGIGGFDLALERQGFNPSFQCEIDGFCQQVLRKHWPKVQLGGDITTIRDVEIPKADVWCGGFPCQDVSVARGSKGREGLNGKNSGLFFSFAERICSKKPSVVLIENVTGLLSSHNGQDFRIVLETLSRMGYTVCWRVMNSRYYGAPQSRPRVFIAAALKDSAIGISSLYETRRGARPRSQRKGFLTPSICHSTGARVAEVAYCLAATSGRHTGTDWSRTYVSYESEVRRLTPTECERLQGFPSGWTKVASPAKSEEFDLDSPRYKALGNAVAVPVARWIAKRMKEKLEEPKTHSTMALDEIASSYGDFRDSSVRRMKLSKLHLSTKSNGTCLKWQSGGLVVGDECWDVRAPEAPSTPIQKKLIKIIERDHPSEKYFLSANAAEGILRRVYSQNRTLFGPMHEALERLIEREGVA